MHATADRATDRAKATRAPSGAPRRKCACGGITGPSGECDECRKKRLAAEARPATPAGTAAHRFGEIRVAAPPAAEAKAKVAPPASDRDDDRVAAQPPLATELVGEEEEDAAAGRDAGAAGEVEVQVVDAPAPAGGAVKAKCPVPKAVKTSHPVWKSSAADIAAMPACRWGETAPDPLQLRVKVCKDGGSWQLRVAGVTSVVRTHSRQLPGQREPSRANSTSTNFCPQVSELDQLGACPGSWYMLQAVRAHEAVHVNEWKSSYPTDWPTQKAIIEGLTVPASGTTADAGAAFTALTALPAYQNALLTSTANYPAFWGIADPNANTIAAERAVVDPRIRDLCVNARNKKWNPGGCPVCSAIGIT